MPTIPPVGSSNPGAPAPGTILLEAANRNAGKTALGQQDFLKLLGAQMTAQNPLEPMKDTEFVAQMASFTSLEQMQGLSKAFDAFAKDQRMAAAPSYLGQQVSLNDPKDGPVTGVVESIVIQNGKPSVVIGGRAYDAATISQITLPSALPKVSSSAQQ
jgi:flagellar basal-body rod modification protein FlgD